MVSFYDEKRRRLNEVEIYDLTSRNVIWVIKEKMRFSGHVARMGKRCIQVGRPEGRRPLGRPRRRWEDNIKMDLQEVRWGVDWIDLAQDKDRWQASH
jgi:hypothetical protein